MAKTESFFLAKIVFRPNVNVLSCFWDHLTTPTHPKSTSLSFAKVVQLYLSILFQTVGFVWCGVCGVDDDGNSDGDASG